jgi:hypothetical protein
MGLRSTLEKLNIPFIKPEVQPVQTDNSIASLLAQIVALLTTQNTNYVAPTGLSATQATSHTVIAAGTTSNTTIKASAGRCFDIIVTAIGTAAIQITDGVSGAVIAEVPASAGLGRYAFNSPALTSIVAVGIANLPAYTILWA